MKRRYTPIILLTLMSLSALTARAQIVGPIVAHTGSDMQHAIEAGILGPLGYSDTQNNSFIPFTNIIGQASNEIYYTFTISEDCTVDISHCGTLIDSYVHLLDITGSELYTNDNDGPLCAPSTAASLSVFLMAGTYYVVSEGAGSATGDIITSISIHPNTTGGSGGTPPVNPALPILRIFASGDQNFVTTTTVRVAGVLTTDKIGYLKLNQIKRSTQYLDGLGRPLQTVALKASHLGNDLIEPFIYDAMGRGSQNLSPYAEQAGNNGLYRSDALTRQTDFYSTSNGWDVDVKKTTSPYAVSVYENSPLGRVIEQGARGTAWQPGLGHTVRIEYNSNTAQGGSFSVKKYKVILPASGITRTLSDAGWYLQGRLLVTITKNENWVSGRGGTTEEYNDKEGKVVLKRVWQDENTVLSTYYVYDTLGNLCFVLTPGASPDNGGISSNILDNFCYQYRYDDKNRLAAKKVAGKGWEEFMYNNLDQMVYSQNADQATRSERSFIKYDIMGRVIMTGVESSSTLTRDQVQASLDGQAKSWEERDANNSYGYTFTYLPNNVASLKILTLNYYDDYNYPGNSFGQPQTSQMQNNRGMATGNKVNVLGTATMLLTANYYNTDSRLEQVKKENYPGGSDIVSNVYEFDGQLTSSSRVHTGPSGQGVTINTRYEYDDAGRLVNTFKNINGTGEVKLSSLDYNEIGQVKKKQLHGGVQVINYKYNERGWLLQANDPANLASNEAFGMQLDYGNHPDAFNGNVGSFSWQTQVPPGIGLSQQMHTYDYTYDKLNRLMQANNTMLGNAGTFSESMTYDIMGNITTLKRTAGSASSYLNDFAYDYASNGTGNKLWSITDAGTAGQSSNYGYDANTGNLVSDSHKALTNVAYNVLNLQEQITVGGNIIRNMYDAAGFKLQKVAGGITTNYINGIIYTNGQIESIQTEEGRALQSGSNYSYEYMLKDHLGNVRATVRQDGSVVQVQDYYAFGMQMDPVNSLSPSPDNKYKYNSKEYQDEYGLNLYDYGARMYDPVIGRMNSIDPKAELMASISTYTYVFNNPLLFTDPTGMEPSYNFDTRQYEDGGKAVNLDDYYAKQQKEEDAQYSWYGASTRNAEQYTGFMATMANIENEVSVGSLSQGITVDGNDDAANQGGDPPTYRLRHIIKDGIEQDNTPFLILFPVLKGVKTVFNLIGLVKKDPVEVLQSLRNLKNLRYNSRLESQTDLFHNFPRSLDKDIIDNAPWAKTIENGGNWFEIPGTIETSKKIYDGTYQIGITDEGVIFHRNFVPFK